MAYTYKYPRPMVTVDGVVFGFDRSQKALQVLLIQRNNPPYAAHWALPGGFVEMTESLETAAMRELQEETGINNIFLEQLYTFGTPNRDERGRVITVAYYALINLANAPNIQAASDARAARWFPIDELPPLAFDHDAILNMGLERLRGKIRYQPIGFELLPEKFPLSELRSLYKAILPEQAHKSIEKRNFRKKIFKMGVLKELEEYQEGVAHRPARLYSFDKVKYQEMEKRGFSYWL